MSRVTADDLAFADTLLDAVKAKDRKAIAQVFASIHERAVACAMVRLEREFEVTRRKQPGLPFDERAEQRT